MKKISMLFCAGVLMSALGAAFVACNDGQNGQGQKSNENEIKPVVLAGEAGNQLTAFFEENVNRIAISIFNTNGTSGMDSRYVMINSDDELPKVDFEGEPFKFPDIDFKAYSLVIGEYKRVMAGGYYVSSRGMTIDSSQINLSIVVGDDKNVIHHHGPVTYPWRPFWGLYPKLPKLPIHIDVVFEPEK